MNRSAPHARVVPVVRVPDVPAAVAFYTHVFGFVEHVLIGDGHRAQLGLPGGPPAELVVAQGATPGDGRAHQILLKVEDVAAVVARAVAAGATLASPAEDFAYGERQAMIHDRFGQAWLVTQTLVDVAPEAWGGKTITPRAG